ncbi:hypothetical protein QTP70_012977 [Hemibagrus guttatus]|uniref:Alkylated DNA repair protein AlkB homologue 8 N-terminal domain-containing protein n=1 Tax=Hemibagrus guttatus TaxID=175788 RepID=A0AAE0V2N9_9TELE|nr:hypothetical protein QTP70_012977 [Hemibagrus guttatus]
MTLLPLAIRRGQEKEYRKLIQDFVAWFDFNNLHLNTTKTREMVVDFRRPRPQPEPVTINGDCVEFVKVYKYLGVQLDDRMGCTANTDALCRRGQSQMYFCRRLASFNICKKMLQMFYQTVVVSALFYVCWGGCIKKKDASHLDKLLHVLTLLEHVKEQQMQVAAAVNNLVARLGTETPVAGMHNNNNSIIVLAQIRPHLARVYPTMNWPRSGMVVAYGITM